MFKFLFSIFEIFDKESFAEMTSEVGVLFTLILYVLISAFFLIFLILCLPLFPFYIFNEWSKKWFNK